MIRPSFPLRRLGATAALCAGLAASCGALAQARAHASDEDIAPALAVEPVSRLAASLQVGDIVFTRIGA